MMSLYVFTSPLTQRQRKLLKRCSHCTIALTICLSQLMRCMGFGVVVTTARCEHLHWIPYKPFVVIRKNRNRNRTVWTDLKFGCWRKRYVWTRHNIVSRKREVTAQTNCHCQSYYTGSRYQRVHLFNIADNDVDTKKSARYSWMFVVTELVVSGTQCIFVRCNVCQYTT